MSSGTDNAEKIISAAEKVITEQCWFYADADIPVAHFDERIAIHIGTDYENGRINIPIEQLIKIADYYNVSIDYIVGRTDNTQTNR